MPMSFDACQTAVQVGAVDMSISGYSWTKERAENFNLSDYYYAGNNETEQVIITKKELEGTFKDAESFRREDRGRPGRLPAAEPGQRAAAQNRHRQGVQGH